MSDIKSVLHRIKKLEEVIEVDEGPYKKVAELLLKRIKDKYKDILKDPNVESESEVDRFAQKSYDQLYEDLGIIYLMFGETYVEEFSYKKWTIKFIKKLEVEEGNSDSCLFSVIVNIYENNKLIAKEVKLSFWKWHPNRKTVRDIGLVVEDHFQLYKYHSHTHWFRKLSQGLIYIWNSYYKDVPLLSEPEKGGYINGY